MTTREENLKKINDELEKLSDEELDNVAGGFGAQTAKDSKLLYEYGLLDDYHRELHVMFHWKSDSADVDAGWRKAGITSVSKLILKDNQYFKDGKEITWEEAQNHVKNNFKQIRNIE